MFSLALGKIDYPVYAHYLLTCDCQVISQWLCTFAVRYTCHLSQQLHPSLVLLLFIHLFTVSSYCQWSLNTMQTLAVNQLFRTGPNYAWLPVTFIVKTFGCFNWIWPGLFTGWKYISGSVSRMHSGNLINAVAVSIYKLWINGLTVIALKMKLM